MIIETLDIIRDLIANWKLKLKISAVDDLGNNQYMVSVCHTYYLHGGSLFSLGGVEYKVISTIKDASVVLEGITLPVVGTYLLPPPFFFHGTLIQTNSELTGIYDMNAKSPMVYLRRPYRDGFNAEDSTVERNSSVTLYFLTEDDFQEPTQEWRDNECIYPMRSLCYTFIEMLRANKYLDDIQDFTVEDKIKFGRYNDKGVEKGYWNTNLSGCELNIDLPIKRNYVCNC